MQSIFIVLALGDYDNDEIEGVFSTEENAENYKNKLLEIRNYTKNKDYGIIELFVDEKTNLVIKTEYSFFGSSNFNNPKTGQRKQLVKENLIGISRYDNGKYFHGFSYESMEHAQELAKEAEARYKKEKRLRNKDKNFIVEISK